MVEKIIVLCLEITLIKVIADDESFKRHFGEVSRKRVLAVDFGDTDGHGRYRAEPSEMRQQFCENQWRNLKKDFSFFEKIRAGILTANNLCAAPLEQAKGLYFVGRELVGEKLINIA